MELGQSSPPSLVGQLVAAGDVRHLQILAVDFADSLLPDPAGILHVVAV